MHINEELFLSKLSTVLQVLGFQSRLVEDEGSPLSIDGVMAGYEAEQVKITILFLPLKEVLGDSVQILQIYISLFDDVKESMYEQLQLICNDANFSMAVGTYGIHENFNILCLKQGVPLKGSYCEEDALNIVVDMILLMAISVDGYYSKMKDVYMSLKE